MALKAKPFFVTFEGIDGCGKTTQLNLAAHYLTGRGYKVRTLREPGSTALAESIRAILLDREAVISPTAELLLYEAARAEIVGAEIAPLLKRGFIVLCDRFYDSTTAYQGYGRKLDIRTVKSLHRIATGKLQPDLTLLFDVDLATADRRMQRTRDRLEAEKPAFHRRVRQGFLQIARQESRRVKLIDGTLPVDQVFEEVKKHLDRKLARI